ncbi:MAG: hypothetical protein PSX81_05910 [bacterium]|nr:hypothetical protein [bacterium]
MNRVMLLQKLPISFVDIDIQPFQDWGETDRLVCFYFKNYESFRAVVKTTYFTDGYAYSNLSGLSENRPIGMFFFKIMNRVRLLQKQPILLVHTQPFQDWGKTDRLVCLFLKS